MFWNIFSSLLSCPFSPGLIFIVIGRGGRGCLFSDVKTHCSNVSKNGGQGGGWLEMEENITEKRA